MLNRDLIQKGNKLRVLQDEINRKWIRVSLWKKASDVFFENGQNFNQILEAEIRRFRNEIMALLTADNGVVFQFGSVIDEAPTGEFPAAWMPPTNISKSVDFDSISNTLTFTIPHPRNIPVVFNVTGKGTAKLYRGNSEVASLTSAGSKTVNYSFQRGVEYKTVTTVPLGENGQYQASIKFTRVGGNPLGIPDDEYTYGVWVNGELVSF